MDSSTRVPVILVNKSRDYDVRVGRVADSVWGPLYALTLPRRGNGAARYFEGYLPFDLVAERVLAHHVALGFDVARPVHVALRAPASGDERVAGLPGMALDAARSDALNYADGSVVVDLGPGQGGGDSRLRITYGFAPLPLAATSTHGVRRDGAFACDSGRTGKLCEIPAVDGRACAGRGLPVYDAGDATRFLRCECVKPFGGPACDCPVDAAGVVCSGHGTCDPRRGVCVCHPGFAGDLCALSTTPWTLVTYVDKASASGKMTGTVIINLGDNRIETSARLGRGSPTDPLPPPVQKYARLPPPPRTGAAEYAIPVSLQFSADTPESEFAPMVAPFVLRLAAGGDPGAKNRVGAYELVNTAVPAGSADPVVTLEIQGDRATVTLLRAPDFAALRCSFTSTTGEVVLTGVRDLGSNTCICNPGRGGNATCTAREDYGAAMWSDGLANGYCVEGVAKRAGEAGAALAELAAAYPVGDAWPLHFVGASCPREGATEFKPGAFRYPLAAFPVSPDASPTGTFAAPVTDVSVPAGIDCRAIGEDTPVRVLFGGDGQKHGPALGCIEGRRCGEIRDAMAAMGVRGVLENAFLDSTSIADAARAGGADGALRDASADDPLACPPDFFGKNLSDTARYGPSQLPVQFSKVPTARPESVVDIDASRSEFCGGDIAPPTWSGCEKMRENPGCSDRGGFREKAARSWIRGGSTCADCCYYIEPRDMGLYDECDLAFGHRGDGDKYLFTWDGYSDEDKVACCLGLVPTDQTQEVEVVPESLIDTKVTSTLRNWRCRPEWCAGSSATACTQIMLDYCSRTAEDPKLCRTATNVAGDADQAQISVADAQTPIGAAKTCSVVAASDELPLARTCRAWVSANPAHGRLLYDRICSDPLHRYRLECSCRNAAVPDSDPWRFYADRSVTQRAVADQISASGGGAFLQDVGCWAPACINSREPTSFPFPADIYLPVAGDTDDRGDGTKPDKPLTCDATNCIIKIGEWVSAGRAAGDVSTIAQSCSAR